MSYNIVIAYYGVYIDFRIGYYSVYTDYGL